MTHFLQLIRRTGLDGNLLSLIVAIVVLGGVLSFVAPGFATLTTLADMILGLLPLLILVVGLMFVLLVGAIDLSMVAIVAITSVVSASLMTSAGGYLAGMPLAVPVGFLTFPLLGAAIGAANGAMSAGLRMPSFMATLGTSLLLGGVAVWYTSIHTRSSSIAGLPEAFIYLGRGTIGPVPIALLIAIVVVGAAWYLLNRTVLGRWLVAVGAGQQAARVSGVPVGMTIVIAFIISGCCAGIASAILTARVQTGSPVLAANMLLDIIGAAVIGGISLYGGSGRLVGALLGVLLLTMVDVGLRLLGVSLFAVLMVKGSVIIVATAIDGLRNRMGAR